MLDSITLEDLSEEVKLFKAMVVKYFGAYCKRGLQSVRSLLLDQILKVMQNIGYLKRLDSFQFKTLNVHIKRASRRTSQRRSRAIRMPMTMMIKFIAGSTNERCKLKAKNDFHKPKSILKRRTLVDKWALPGEKMWRNDPRTNYKGYWFNWVGKKENRSF